MSNKSVVIIPTTGTNELGAAVQSVLDQTEPSTCYVVCDGQKYVDSVTSQLTKFTNANIRICFLPENVGANGFYGHRIYAAFSHLVNEDYVLFLDQDNWFDPTHVEECIKTIEEDNLQWCYTLRKIVDKDGKFICNDDCESLGLHQAWTNVNHIDTNTYCIRREHLIQVASSWHGGWGQDRVFLATMAQYKKKFAGTGLYTVNYRLDGNPGSVQKEFFEQGNMTMNEKYKGVYPWTK